MKGAFLDTSVVFKLYHREESTEHYRRLLTRGGAVRLIISRYTLLEFSSICARMVRMQEMLESDASNLLALFNADTSKFELVDLSNSILEVAQRLIHQFGAKGLRAPDAIQLATALSLREEASLHLSADQLLTSLFVELDLPIA